MWDKRPTTEAAQVAIANTTLYALLDWTVAACGGPLVCSWLIVLVLCAPRKLCLLLDTLARMYIQMKGELDLFDERLKMMHERN